MNYYLRKVLLLLLLFVTSFKQSIYNYIPQRKHIYILTCILSAIIYLQINASNFIIIIIIITIINIMYITHIIYMYILYIFAGILYLQINA